MSAVSIGKLMAGAISVPSAETHVRLWRRTYSVDDRRADVGRKLGDGSARQGKIVLATIVEAAKKWFDTENKEGRAAYAQAQRAYADSPAVSPAPKKKRVLKWNLLNTLGAVLNFIDFKTGECIATYEMIAAAADICRDTVYKHLNILRGLGLIDWVRRCEPTGNKVGQKVKAAPNSYYFEITRLPSRVQMLIRQILARRGVKLEAHPDRVGSGAVPNRVQRIASRLARGLSHTKDMFTGRRHRDAKLAVPQEHRNAGGGKLRRRGGLRRKAMFRRLASSRFLKTGTDDQGFWVGFSGKVSQIADVHQHGLRDRPSLRGNAVPYPRRELLDATTADGERLLDLLYEHLAAA